MVRLIAILAALGASLPRPASAEEVYSFIDADGVIHVTNIPQDARFRKVRVKVAPVDGVHRIAINGRKPPLLLRRGSTYDVHIQAAAEKYGLAPPLLRAVMAVESNFNPGAVSEKGATGLMQLMPDTARDMLVEDLLDPGQNIDGGARYLRHLQNQFGNDLEKVLAAYNAGPEAVRRSGGAVPPFRETQAYVKKVLALYDSYMRGR
ncbi:MAG TPA: lytic transglycosylase domain-containing protein [Anaeromyxobacteraceae bacterium]|nr:lytic transglycosylase domain-containing protein [Anaeromyxobacteraceae bacterium]